MEVLIDKILEFIKAAQFAGIESYFFGDPITYPSFNLPAIAVAPLRTEVTAYTMAKDKHSLAVRIYIMKSARDGFQQATNESPVDRSLVDIVSHIIDTLRGNITLGNTVATFDSAGVQYVPAVRGREAIRMAQIDAIFTVFKSR